MVIMCVYMYMYRTCYKSGFLSLVIAHFMCKPHASYGFSFNFSLLFYFTLHFMLVRIEKKKKRMKHQPQGD